MQIEFTVLGEPASKANSRRLVSFRNKQTGKVRPGSIKSKKALGYVEAFQMQCPRQTPLLEGDLWVKLKIWYASRRSDLDESVILDAMQGLIYENDRQVKRRYAEWGLDKNNPRAEISVGTLSASPGFGVSLNATGAAPG